jgi:hypothetical protein
MHVLINAPITQLKNCVSHMIYSHYLFETNRVFETLLLTFNQTIIPSSLSAQNNQLACKYTNHSKQKRGNVPFSEQWIRIRKACIAGYSCFLMAF